MSLKGAKMLSLKDKHEAEEALLKIKEIPTPKKVKVVKLGNKQKGKK